MRVFATFVAAAPLALLNACQSDASALAARASEVREQCISNALSRLKESGGGSDESSVRAVTGNCDCAIERITRGKERESQVDWVTGLDKAARACAGIRDPDAYP